MKQIVIARHAKSDWSMGLPDMDRPLNSRGLKDAPAMGRLLADYNFQADRIVSSPANRAKTTAGLVAKELGYSKEILLDSRIYFQGASEIINLLKELPPEVDSVMVFGHNPTHEELAEHLLGMNASITMPTAGMICLETMGDWSGLKPGNFQLKWFLIPRLIRPSKKGF